MRAVLFVREVSAEDVDVGQRDALPQRRLAARIAQRSAKVLATCVNSG
jgi:hypothetical protein